MVLNRIVNRNQLAENIIAIDIEAPLLAKKALPGQFVVVVPTENAERIPLTIADSDLVKGTIKIIFQAAGATTKVLSSLKIGGSIAHLLGPLGIPSEVGKFGRVAVIGGGVGIAEIYPVVKALKGAGNEVITIIGARNKELLIMERELKAESSKLSVTTDDGSYGRKGFVSDELTDLLKAVKVDRVIAVGPVPMMKAVCAITKSAGIKTVVSLNTLMLDATGMCGICRVTVGGQVKFACVEGPEFDGHQVDFDELSSRLKMYQEVEKTAYDHVCRLLNG